MMCLVLYFRNLHLWMQNRVGRYSGECLRWRRVQVWSGQLYQVGIGILIILNKFCFGFEKRKKLPILKEKRQWWRVEWFLKFEMDQFLLKCKAFSRVARPMNIKSFTLLYKFCAPGSNLFADFIFTLYTCIRVDGNLQKGCELGKWLPGVW